MSTKATITHGEKFHFYHECFDDDHVYLQLEGAEYEANREQVTVAVPVDIWEVIRHRGSPRLDLIDYSDEELQLLVEREVDEHIAEYNRHAPEDESGRALVSLGGSFVYGRADASRAEQLDRGLKHFTEERARQRQIAARVAELRGAPASIEEEKIAAELLEMLMAQMSEDYWCASWLSGIEYQLWDCVQGLSDNFPQQAAQAQWLSEKCRGWVMWDDASGGSRFVRLREWERLFHDWKMEQLKRQ